MPGPARRLSGHRAMLPWGCPVTALTLVLLLVVGVAGNASYLGRLRHPRTFPQKSWPCPAPQYFLDKSSRQCCRSCPAGHFLKAPCTESWGPSLCQPCHEDTFLSREDHMEERCSRCQACDEDDPANQVVVRNCSTVANTQCGCAPGWFRECSVSLSQCRADSPFHCIRCPDCKAVRGQTQSPCSGKDTDCGRCLPGFCQDQNGCAPCPTFENKKRLPTTMGPTSAGGRLTTYSPKHFLSIGSWLQYFLLASTVLTILLLLGWGLFYSYQKCFAPMPRAHYQTEMEALKRQWVINPSPVGRASLPLNTYSEKICALQLVGNCSPSSPPLAREVQSPDDSWPVLWSQPPNRGSGPGAGTLQPGPQLYQVMDAVPARRWKEFVRTLGLREAEIEAVEAEIGRFRDQQYEMLKRWRQQQPAGLDAVYAALERMGLEGCAEDLRSRLQRGP
ncbi:tumor necrosis factor receptor superfamily member 25 [Gracilinanus agilis]|uniref:tumor necrosis factor receptor superfamily member 25 n=1 Tax=Gracilinanus agilis TaxID=191870 RepID=UPI001CFE79DE|nr:tumor necrosis factor receptor superfamily member 25 [Gracilinanus agilis]